ncbi:oxalate decarboxylase family bicupin [Bacillus atrophaeus]|uniref:oxalate decarboxylase family bicupin n=1 Tax=Bacillus atrophaeus TaxID=1452 RepID=UPI002281062F|nr:oxalate decarboxylase family bicupin [Bacillus atrophaeus]MCY8498952.1 oxalate decarboxylase family bicupin [Bacillus atrophaeus]MCY8811333.1 oxalate decarboxylase family bicupin [Bacillus atrophaeus]MCY8819907.1 oxalate decarboxylase family bicupin [Bacillus atrophaeus]MCY8828893.1 oxalate decarboxylase family bicupin [Bacillus atrophaeus]MCY8834099.1 oxalate decarboxylase family bicupin [Bacillus atrophaeus]
MKKIIQQMPSSRIPQPIRGDKGATDDGPRNLERDLQNPDMLVPPPTDAGIIENLKFSFSDTHMRLEHGGWSREVTVRELPAATQLAAVNMRLKPGGVRELHWHKEAEWGYVLNGKVRITAVDQKGRNFIDDVGEGDLWYFPSGIPHSIQGLEEGSEFLLVFDNGSFSENSTFSVTDWFAHTPRSVLAANFGIPGYELAHIPAKERYMFQLGMPPSINEVKIDSPNGTVPEPFSYKLTKQAPIITNGGKVRIADSSLFKASKTIAAAVVEVEPGGMREMHWHPNTDEWQYYISGKAKMTVFAAEGKARTFNYQAGDVGYVPFAMGHYIQNTGSTVLRFLEVFKSDRFEDVSLNQWLALTPHGFMQRTLNVGAAFTDVLQKEKFPVVKWKSD